MLNKYTLKKEDSLLLVIDIQEKLVPAMKNKEEVIKNSKTLIEGSELLDLPMILTEQYPKGLGSTIKELTEEKDFRAEIIKTQFSAYTEPLKVQLKSLGKKNIIVLGMESHVCVLQTVRDLLKEDYQVHLASDAMSSRTTENHLNALDFMQKMGAVSSNTETILFDLLKDAKRKEFKSISKLIK